MILLPIVDRELRVGARRRATYRTRLWAALASILVSAYMCLSFSWRDASTNLQGTSLFYTLATMAFLYSVFIGARATSDCLSEEKREGTLGLLFLTDLKGWDVVLGKLVASSLNSVYGLIAFVPILAMSLLLGGVTLAQLGKMVLVLLSTLFFSLSAGIFVSALSRNERKAISATVLLVLAPAAIPFGAVFFLVAVLERVQDPRALNQLALWLIGNPFYAFFHALPIPRLPVALPLWSFWVSLAIVHLMSWIFLFATARIVPFIWRDRAQARPARQLTWTERWRLFTHGNPAQRKDLRDRLLGRNAFLWLVSRDRLKPAYVWLFLASMVAVWYWGRHQNDEVMFDFYPLVPTLLLIHTFLKAWVVSEVTHRLVEDQRSGALELLLSTPLTNQDILSGQRMALTRQFGPPVLLLCALELALFHNRFPFGVVLSVLAMLIADLFTLMFVAMRLSLKARSINEVFLKSFVWVLVLPWVVHLTAWPFYEALVRSVWLKAWAPSFGDKVYFWFAVGMINNFILVVCWARPHLLRDFRDALLQRFDGVTPSIRKWLSWPLKTEA